MAVSSGFFNSVNHDRLYDAEQFSSIFDGIILDGVYENFGEAFKVTAYSEANDTVIVGTGRAWFDHTWTYNDSQFSITLDPPNEMLDRVDMIVIDVNREQGVRQNTIKYVRGMESTPTKPVPLIKEDLHKQYPIAYIKITHGESKVISQSSIENKVGSSDCPVVTSFLEAMNLANMWSQLDSEFREWWETVRNSIDESGILELVARLDEIEADLSDLTSKLPLEKPKLSFNMVNIKSNAVFLPDGKYLYYNYEDLNLYLFNSDGIQLSKTATSFPAGTASGSGGRYRHDFVTIKDDAYPCMFMAVYGHLSKDSYDVTAVQYFDTFTITEDGVVSHSLTSSTYANAIYMRYDKITTDGASVKSYTTMDGNIYVPYIFGSTDHYSTSFESRCFAVVAKFGPDGTKLATIGALDDSEYNTQPNWMAGYAGSKFYNRTYADIAERYLYIDAQLKYSNGTSQHGAYDLGNIYSGVHINSTYIPINISNFSFVHGINSSSSEFSIFPRSSSDLKLPYSSTESGNILSWDDLETYTRNGEKHTINIKQYDNAVKINVPYGYTDILPYNDEIAICKTGLSNVIGIIYKGFRYYFEGNESNIGISSTSTTLDDKITINDGTTLLYCFDAIPKITFSSNGQWTAGNVSDSNNGFKFSIPAERSQTDTESNSGSVIYLKEV